MAVLGRVLPQVRRVGANSHLWVTRSPDRSNGSASSGAFGAVDVAVRPDGGPTRPRRDGWRPASRDGWRPATNVLGTGRRH